MGEEWQISQTGRTGDRKREKSAGNTLKRKAESPGIPPDFFLFFKTIREKSL